MRCIMDKKEKHEMNKKFISHLKQVVGHGDDKIMTQVELAQRIGYTEASNNVKFNDVLKDSWYYNDISIALNKGYINLKHFLRFHIY